MAETKNIFNSISQSYDLWYDTEGKHIYESELDCVRPFIKNGDRIIEVGAGTGRFAMHFKSAIGLDPSLNALSIAKRRGVKAVCGRGENLPFKNNVFDCVLFVLTLCFVRNPLIAIKEAKRILKDSGRAVICFIPKDSSWGRLYEEKKEKGHPVYKEAEFYTFEEIEGFLGKIGFRVLRVKSALFQPPEGERLRERVFDGYSKDAGFVCVEAVKESSA
ncbi:MAG: methyltransferase domain-containing protein [Thermodesulfobacteriota bacterium]